MVCEIKIEMNNAAFEDSPASELGRILWDLAESLEGDPRIGVGLDQPLRDLNGNTVGRVRIMGEAKAEGW